MSTTAADHWDTIDESVLEGQEYTNAERGWVNSITGAEVIIFHTDGTGLEETLDGDWAVQHPLDGSEEHTQGFETFAAARDFAIEYMESHPEPEDEY